MASLTMLNKLGRYGAVGVVAARGAFGLRADALREG